MPCAPGSPRRIVIVVFCDRLKQGPGSKVLKGGPRHGQVRHGRHRHTEPDPGLRRYTEPFIADGKTIMLFGDGREMVQTIVKAVPFGCRARFAVGTRLLERERQG